MTTVLNGSVGLGGNNQRDDVIAVQTMLASCGFKLGRADGVCGPRTLAAIKAFQQGFMHMPDGRIDKAGTTLKKLTDLASPGGAPLEPIPIRWNALVAVSFETPASRAPQDEGFWLEIMALQQNPSS
jgi:peptidoglycan hydrolase-like protein with peptidoglycan-binding domain